MLGGTPAPSPATPDPRPSPRAPTLRAGGFDQRGQDRVDGVLVGAAIDEILGQRLGDLQRLEPGGEDEFGWAVPSCPSDDQGAPPLIPHPPRPTPAPARLPLRGARHRGRLAGEGVGVPGRAPRPAGPTIGQGAARDSRAVVERFGLGVERGASALRRRPKFAAWDTGAARTRPKARGSGRLARRGPGCATTSPTFAIGAAGTRPHSRA